MITLSLVKAIIFALALILALGAEAGRVGPAESAIAGAALVLDLAQGMAP